MKEALEILGRILVRTPFLAVQFVIAFFLTLIFALFTFGGGARVFESLVMFWEDFDAWTALLHTGGFVVSAGLVWLLFQVMRFSIKSMLESARELEEDVGSVFSVVRGRRVEDVSDDVLRGGISLDASAGGGGGLSMAKAAAQELELVLDVAGEEVEVCDEVAQEHEVRRG